jgi:DNA-binding NarL/FixJ family response regulator
MLYGLALAGLLLLLRAVEYKYVVYDVSIEYYIGIVALICLGLGLWLGRKITARASESAMPPVGDPSPSSPTISPVVSQPASDFGISPREREVLRLIAAGHSNQEIADKLFLSLNTIKKHSSALFSKLEVQRRTQAIDKGKRFGLIE